MIALLRLTGAAVGAEMFREDAKAVMTILIQTNRTLAAGRVGRAL